MIYILIGLIVFIVMIAYNIMEDNSFLWSLPPAISTSFMAFLMSMLIIVLPASKLGEICNYIDYEPEYIYKLVPVDKENHYLSCHYSDKDKGQIYNCLYVKDGFYYSESVDMKNENIEFYYIKTTDSSSIVHQNAIYTNKWFKILFIAPASYDKYEFYIPKNSINWIE